MKTLVSFLALVAVAVASPTFNYVYPQAAPKGYVQVQQPAAATYTGPGLFSTQYHAQDTLGSYKFGYSSSDGQEKAEARDYTGRVAGKYSYTDADGDEVELKYVADKDGFRAEGEHLPKAPVQEEQPEFLKKAYKEAEDRLQQARIGAAVSTQYTGEQRAVFPAVATYGGFKSVTSTSSFGPAPAPAPKVTSTSYTTTYSRPAATTYVRPEATTYVRPEATTYVRPEATTYVRPEATTYVRPEATIYVRPEATKYVRPEATTYIRPEVTTYVRPVEPTTYFRPQTTFVEAPSAPVAPVEQTVYTTYTAVQPSTTYVQHQVPARPQGFVYTSSSSTGGAAATAGKSVDTQHHHHHVQLPGGGAVTQPATIITIPTSTQAPTPKPVELIPVPSYPGKSGGTYVYRY